MTSAAVRPPSFRDGGRAVLEWLRVMRDEHPVHHDGNGVWHVFRHADVSRVVDDPVSFSSDQSRVMPAAARWTRGNLNSVDPPAHGALRRLVSRAFTPQTVAGLRPRVERVCAALLDAAGDEFDFVADFAGPLPVTVIADLLGVPADDLGLFRAWADRLLTTRLDYRDAAASAAAHERATGELHAYLLEHCRDRRTRPRDDLITALVAAEADGRRLDDVEVVNFAALLLVAGHVSSTALLGNTVLCLEDDPAAWRRLCDDRSVLPTLVEEVLRYRPPFAMLGRFTTVDVRLGDRVVPAGAVVTPWLLSANHDERRFDRPERFDPRRNPNPHLAFGRGPHFCLGAPLARLEAHVALTALLDRFTGLRVVPGARLDFHEHAVHSAKRIPVTVTRGAAR
ncbi:Erythromycin C-12 hydroxylase [Actinosynnema sp. ALI-1.44]